VFYLANAGYADRIDFSFQSIDHFLATSKALCDLYQQTMGIEVNHIKDLISTKVSADNLDMKRLANRKKRMVLMVNPEPSKGGLFFINLAKQVKRIDPEIRFSAVETRFTKSDWLRLGVKDSDLDYIEWLPSAVDMSDYYFDTSILLMPSLGYEASGRVIVEALKWGIPVLAMNNGGIEEQLNKGGFLFELPKKLKENHFAAADKEDLDCWAKYIGVLQNNDEIYKQSVKLALDAASGYDSLAI
jgi:glycosyltransferase involved in cell wall biosynthesis